MGHMGSDYNIRKAIFYLLKGDCNTGLEQVVQGGLSRRLRVSYLVPIDFDM